MYLTHKARQSEKAYCFHFISEGPSPYCGAKNHQFILIIYMELENCVFSHTLKSKCNKYLSVTGVGFKTRPQQLL